MEKTKPNEPWKMDAIYAAILAHPDYKNLTESMRVAFEDGCVGGEDIYTHPRKKANNRWARQIWRHLYLGEPLP